MRTRQLKATREVGTNRARTESLEARLLCRTFDLTTYHAEGATHAAVADLDGDGIVDVAVAGAKGEVWLFRGTGDGSLQASGLVPVGVRCREVVLGDFTGDGRPDVVALDGVTTRIMLAANTGGGSFAPALDVGPGGQFLLAADFNRDGRLDLAAPLGKATAGPKPRALHVRLGNGDGTFAAPMPVEPRLRAGSAAVADFNTDGIPDLVLARSGPASMRVVLGNGDGTFRFSANVPGTFKGGGTRRLVVAADFNGDGVIDLAGQRVSELRVSSGRGNGTFERAARYRGGGTELAAGDVNGDGAADLVATVSENLFDSRSVRIRFGVRGGPLTEHHGIGEVGHDDRVITADLDADGRADVLILQEKEDTLKVLLRFANA